MGKISDLLPTANAIRDALLENENTALRVGGFLSSLVQALNETLPTKTVDANSITVTRLANMVYLNFRTLGSDGTSATKTVALLPASSSAAGLMSATDRNKLYEAADNASNAKESADSLAATVVEMEQAISETGTEVVPFAGYADGKYATANTATYTGDCTWDMVYYDRTASRMVVAVESGGTLRYFRMSAWLAYRTSAGMPDEHRIYYCVGDKELCKADSTGTLTPVWSGSSSSSGSTGGICHYAENVTALKVPESLVKNSTEAPENPLGWQDVVYHTSLKLFLYRAENPAYNTQIAGSQRYLYKKDLSGAIEAWGANADCTAVLNRVYVCHAEDRQYYRTKYTRSNGIEGDKYAPLNDYDSSVSSLESQVQGCADYAFFFTIPYSFESLQAKAVSTSRTILGKPEVSYTLTDKDSDITYADFFALFVDKTKRCRAVITLEGSASATMIEVGRDYLRKYSGSQTINDLVISTPFLGTDGSYYRFVFWEALVEIWKDSILAQALD